MAAGRRIREVGEFGVDGEGVGAQRRAVVDDVDADGSVGAMAHRAIGVGAHAVIAAGNDDKVPAWDREQEISGLVIFDGGENSVPLGNEAVDVVGAKVLDNGLDG